MFRLLAGPVLAPSQGDSWPFLESVSDYGYRAFLTSPNASALIILSATQVPARSDNVCGFSEG